MKKFIINGLFYTQKTTGVHRFARELLKELDQIIDKNVVSIVVPSSAVDLPNFKNIEVIKYGSHTGMLWEQIDLPRYAKKIKATLISLCNSQPLLHPGIICIHDAAYKTHPEFFKTLHGKMSVLWHKLVYWQATRCTDFPILTVSYFSKYSIIDTYKIKPSRVHVVSNGWQHLKQYNQDDSILSKHGLTKGEFYFTLGNINYNKNTRWVVEYAQQHPTEIFVLSGIRVKNSSIDIDHTPNIKYLGFLSDAEIASLYANCKAFIFPSIHEGFGIPPMEALCYGAEAVVANTSCLPEIYGNTVHYIDAYDTGIDLEELIKEPVANPRYVLDKYSWEKTAKKMLDFLKSIKE